MDPNKKITIELKAVDLDKVLVGLSKLPFEIVFELIPYLRNQGLSQIDDKVPE